MIPNNINIMKILGSLMEFRNIFADNHAGRIECFLRVLAQEMLSLNIYANVLRTWDMESFIHSAVLYDVGKIAVRGDILVKPDKLNSEEFNEMKKHTFFGECIISMMQQSMPEGMYFFHAYNTIGTHHERWDGKGYPYGLKGKTIPLEGRLAALADVFDALISERPYRKALGFGEAVDVIKEERGKHFDPQLTDAFLASSFHLKGLTLIWSLENCRAPNAASPVHGEFYPIGEDRACAENVPPDPAAHP
jgi:putative two-component system response regulator